MDKKFTELDLVTKNQINDNNLLFIQDISETETKNLIFSDLNKYVISSSNILSFSRSGSFTGSFFGIISGSSLTSSHSDISNHSQTTFLLNYKPEISNGSSSYSIYSQSSSLSTSSSFNISSSFSITSSYSDKTSYVSLLTANTSSTSISASNSNISSYSNESLFLNYSGINNGTCLRSIISETSELSIISKNLYPDNTSTSSRAISSSHALFSENAFYIQKTGYSKTCGKSQYTSKNVYSYINFQVTDVNKFDIYSWKNIDIERKIEFVNISNTMATFYIYFNDKLRETETSTVVSDWNFITTNSVRDAVLFKQFSYPNKHYGMIVGVWDIGIYYGGGDGSWTVGDVNRVLIGSTFSVVAYKSTQKFPVNTPPIVSSNTIIQVGGCAAL